MNYTTVMYLLIGAGVVCFTTAVILFFALHIPAVFGELTGRTAKKEIARLKEKDMEGGKAKKNSRSVGPRSKRRTTEPLPVIEPVRDEKRETPSPEEDTAPLVKVPGDEKRKIPDDLTMDTVPHQLDKKIENLVFIGTKGNALGLPKNNSDLMVRGDDVVEHTEELPRGGSSTDAFSLITDIYVVHTDERIE